MIFTEPIFTGYSATGTFATRYSGSQQATTQFKDTTFILLDSTRRALIHTLNLNNGYYNVYELSDLDNNWTHGEHSASENDMGLDIHWGLQKIYDYLYNTYQINSFNDNGFPIRAYIHYIEKDKAYWERDSHVLLFGDGNNDFKPIASIDAVSHEFGHGITQFQIGWQYSGIEAAFDEGLSDIWGAILEFRIKPNSVWKIGEQVTLNYECYRNLQNTNDPNAKKKIANTYQGAQYNNTNSDQYVRGGVFSHWFYLLVNGGSGTNDIGNSYNVQGIGMDKAEQLIVESVFNNYLSQTDSYPVLANNIIQAAKSLFCANSNEVKAVTNAWYAVGVGNSYSGSIAYISGSDRICTSQTYYVINPPSGITSTSWSTSSSSSLTVNSTGTASRANGYNGYASVYATLNGDSSCLLNVSKEVWVGVPVINYISGPQHAEVIQVEEVYQAEPNYSLSDPTYSWQVSPSYYTLWANSNYARISFPYDGDYYVSANAQNACGTSNSAQLFVAVGAYEPYIITPNPASESFSISIPIASSINSSIDPAGRNKSKRFLQAPNYSVEVYNSVGRLVYEGRFPGNSLSIPTASFLDGTYIVVLRDGLNVFRKQLLVKH